MTPPDPSDELATVLRRAGLPEPRTERAQLAVYATALDGWRRVHSLHVAPGDDPFHVGAAPAPAGPGA